MTTTDNMTVSVPPSSCPLCDRAMVQRSSSFGTFYGCTGYSKGECFCIVTMEGKVKVGNKGNGNRARSQQRAYWAKRKASPVPVTQTATPKVDSTLPAKAKETFVCDWCKLESAVYNKIKVGSRGYACNWTCYDNMVQHAAMIWNLFENIPVIFQGIDRARREMVKAFAELLGVIAATMQACRMDILPAECTVTFKLSSGEYYTVAPSTGNARLDGAVKLILQAKGAKWGHTYSPDLIPLIKEHGSLDTAMARFALLS